MPSESTQHKLTRVRRPRVQITYDVETEGGVVVKELPFVVGVLGDFSGEPTAPKPALKDRKFIQIDRDNFNDVMKKMTPGANFRVDNTLADDGKEISVQLSFNSMDDFEPGQVVEQVPALKKLLEARNRLRDLLTRVDRSEELEIVLEECLTDESQMNDLSSSLPAEAKEDGNGEAQSESEGTSEPAAEAGEDTPEGTE